MLSHNIIRQRGQKEKCMGFKKLYIGSIFLLTVSIVNFNVLPNLIAYVFFILGIRQLNNEYGGFDKAYLAAVFCMPFGIIDFFYNTLKIDIIGYMNNTLVNGSLVFADRLLALTMVLLTLNRLIEVYEEIKDQKLKEDCEKVRKKFFILNIVLILLVPLSILFPEEVSFSYQGMLSWILILPALAALIVYLNVYSSLIYHFSEAHRKLKFDLKRS